MTRKFPLIAINGSKIVGRSLTINLTRYAGADFRLMRDAKEQLCLVIVAWLSTNGKTLRYWYPSLTLPFVRRPKLPIA